MYYKVTFKWDNDLWCTNIAKASNIDQVEKHYKEYEKYIIREAAPFEISEARAKGMPIIDCGS